MNRDKNLKAARAAFVKEYISKRPSQPVGDVIRLLSKRLFLSEATIWNDYTGFTQNRSK